LLCSWSGSAAPDAQAPGTRVEQWVRLRAEKAARTREPRPGFLERALLAVEQSKRPSLFGLNVAGFHPRVHDIASGSETAGGLRFWQPDVGGSRVDVHASAFYSIRGYEYYDLQVGRVAHEGDGLPNRSTKGDDVYELGDVGRLTAGRAIAYGSVRYRHYPETAFYGLGAAARADGRTSFLSQDALYEIVAGYEGPRGAATVRGGLLQAFVGPGTEEDVPQIRARYDDRSAPGLDRQPDFIHLAATLLLDGRDRPGNPHRGGMIAAGAERFAQRGGGEFTFDRITGDARAFAPLGSPQRVLALRALASADRPAAGARVPFYLQEPLGGSRTLRGFRTFRFRGETLLLLQAEYRWEAWPALELALFADAGRAYGPGEDTALRALESDVGFGVRLKAHNAVLARIDVARSREDTRFLLRLGPSF
jgi:hypothetical protein